MSYSDGQYNRYVSFLGNFGDVYQAVLNSTTPVAVKSIHGKRYLVELIYG